MERRVSRRMGIPKIFEVRGVPPLGIRQTTAEYNSAVQNLIKVRAGAALEARIEGELSEETQTELDGARIEFQRVSREMKRRQKPGIEVTIFSKKITIR